MPNPTPDPRGDLTRHVTDAQAGLAAILASPGLVTALAVCHFELDSVAQLEARHVARIEQTLWHTNEVLSSWSTTHDPAPLAVAGAPR